MGQSVELILQFANKTWFMFEKLPYLKFSDSLQGEAPLVVNREERVGKTPL